VERERSRDAERIKDLFLGAVGHDLRSPLNAILVAAQLMLQDDGFESTTHHAYAEKIERAGRRMQRMIEDILDLTRGQFAGGIPLLPQSMDLGDVTRTVVDEHRLARRGCVVELDVTGDVGGCWDTARIERVLSNLVGNAVEHGRDAPVRSVFETKAHGSRSRCGMRARRSSRRCCRKSSIHFVAAIPAPLASASDST
jgi:signal transduction histidine kinase